MTENLYIKEKKKILSFSAVHSFLFITLKVKISTKVTLKIVILYYNHYRGTSNQCWQMNPGKSRGLCK